MNIEYLVQLLTVILAISLASERLITFLKTMIPWLAGNKDPGQQPLPETDFTRKIVVMLIAFFAAWITSALLLDPFDLFGTIVFDKDKPSFPVYIIGLLASGGSAFWTTLLGYTKAVRDVEIEKSTQEKMVTQTKFKSMKFNMKGLDANVLTLTNVADQVKQIILNVSDLPGDISMLDETSTLSSLGFNSNMCNDLAQKLNTFVKTVKLTAFVNNAEISASMTVKKVIDLIKTKIP